MHPDVYPDQVHRDALDEQIAAYKRERSRMEADYSAKWVVFSGGRFWRAFDTFQEAALAAERELGDVVTLIHQVGEPDTIPMPSSLLCLTR